MFTDFRTSLVARAKHALESREKIAVEEKYMYLREVASGMFENCLLKL